MRYHAQPRAVRLHGPGSPPDCATCAARPPEPSRAGAWPARPAAHRRRGGLPAKAAALVTEPHL
eukprot:scaffold98408_cov90-Phaeocystis_antarctica.AAC.1